MTTATVSTSKGGLAAVTGGLTIVGLGVIGAFWPAAVSGPWFIAAGVAAGLLAVGIIGLRARVVAITTARHALAVSAVAMTLFALAHFSALINEDLAVLLFSMFMIIGSIGMIIAGAAILRERPQRGWTRAIPLVCGVWPILTIPAGAAIGDLPHFGAIALWGLCWTALGARLIERRHGRSLGTAPPHDHNVLGRSLQ